MATREMCYDGLNAFDLKMIEKNIDYFQLPVPAPVRGPVYELCSLAYGTCQNKQSYHFNGGVYALCPYGGLPSSYGGAHEACAAYNECGVNGVFHLK
jgi:hypothetical protein